jgi:hypothetical protein
MTKGAFKRRNRISGQWSRRLIEMLEFPAYRALGQSAHRVISRIEIELAHHDRGSPSSSTGLGPTSSKFRKFGFVKETHADENQNTR